MVGNLCTAGQTAAPQSKGVRYIRTLLISYERDSILSDTVQITMESEVQVIFHTNHQQDAHESLLSTLDIVHIHTKINLFPGCAFLQETMKYSSIIRNTFYGIINSTHTCTARKLPLPHLAHVSLKQHLEVIQALVYLCLNIIIFMQQ